jgi:extracellular elastinolytic metalloproteinase
MLTTLRGLKDRDRKGNRKGQLARRRGRLRLESLEDRVLLTVDPGLNPKPPVVGPVGWAPTAQAIHVEAPYVPSSRSLQVLGGYLSEPSPAEPLDIALGFFHAHAVALGLAPEDVSQIDVTDSYTDRRSGTSHIYLRQKINGLEVSNALANVTIDRFGRVVSVHSTFVGGLARAEWSTPPVPSITASQAVLAAAQDTGYGLSAQPIELHGAGGPGQGSMVLAFEFSREAIPARLHYVATPDGGAQLAWNLIAQTPDGDHWYDLSIDAATGAVLATHDWVDHATYNALPFPATESPDDGPRALIVDPQDSTASPFGWHDTDGVAGAEFTDTRGNNTFAQEDVDFNNTGGFRPDGGAGLVFDFPLDLTQEPSTYQSASITNLFFATNVLHDVLYQYGFDEISGNFQVNNYGNGGAEGDPLQADAQDGEGTNNANMATPPDGFSPRMQMFIFTLTTPLRDGSFDNGIIAHEFGHGVSNRLTGGPANSNALDAIQSGGMGEGWSDWFALMFTQKPTDAPGDAYPMGNYALGQPPTGGGIRRFPYSFDMAINPLTLGAYSNSQQVHDAGEIWASVLWDLNWLLIDKHGFSPDLDAGYNGAGSSGNQLLMQLVLDGMKLQPANPSFLQARDAILMADQLLTGGGNFREIWTAFARRGFGLSAVDGGADSFSVTEAFDTPNFALHVTTTDPAVGSIISTQPADFLVNFSEAYDPASIDAGDFTVNGTPADSFTLDDADTITFHFDATPVTTEGLQTMAIAEGAIARLSDGGPIDAFTGTFRYDAVLMQVVSTVPADGSLVPLPLTSLLVNFNEPYEPDTVDTGDLSISQGSVTGFNLVDADTVEYLLAGIDSEGTLTIHFDAGALTDAFGNPMASYDGTLLLDFGTVAYPVPLESKAPAGSLVYDPGASGTIATGTDADTFTISVDPGQRVTVILHPHGNTLRGRIELIANDEPGSPVLASRTASLRGLDAVIQAYSLTALAGSPTAARDLSIRVSSAGGTTGGYDLQVILNADAEMESHNGPSNHTRAAAQGLGSFTTLAGGATRAAALGSITGGIAAGDAFVVVRGLFGGPGGEVRHYNGAGQLVGIIDSPRFDEGFISDIEIGPAGDLFVALDPDDLGGNGELLRFSFAGAFLGSIVLPPDIGPDFFHPFGFDVAPDGTIWVTQLNSGNVVHATATGELIASYFVGGLPVDVAIGADGIAYVSNPGIFEVQRLDTSTSAVTTFASFVSPIGINVTAGGEVIVSDSNGAVNRYDSAGNLLQSIFHFSAEDSQNDPSGNIWSSSFNGNTLARFDPSGNFQFSVNLGSFPIGIAVVGTDGGAVPLRPQDVADHYSFTLATGQSAMVHVTSTNGRNVVVDLLDATGAVLATGHSSASNLGSLISDYIASAAGKFYVKVTGDRGAEYNLVVTKSASFDTEDNDSLETAQGLVGSATNGNSRVALGFLEASGLDHSGGFADPSDLVNNGSAFFTDGVARLTTSDAVVAGSVFSRSPVAITSFDTSFRFRIAPGSIPMADGMTFTIQGVGNTALGFVGSSLGYEGIPNSVAIKFDIWDNENGGFADSETGLYVGGQYPGQPSIDLLAAGIDLTSQHVFDVAMSYDGTVLEVTITDTETLVSATQTYTIDIAAQVGGDAAFVGFTGATGGLSAVHEVLSWTFDGAPEPDIYRVGANAGATIVAQTLTPGGGPGEFVNLLDPMVRIYDSAGNMVAENDNGAADGRNASASYLVPAGGGGIYYVEVVPSPLTPASTSGEYVLRVAGTNGARPPFRVVASDPVDGAVMKLQPEEVILDFNDNILLATLQAADVTVNGSPATALRIIDGNTAAFTIPGGLGEGTHTVAIAAGALTDTQGTPIDAFSTQFRLDLTAPRIVSSSIQEDDILPAGGVTYTAIFSEPMRTDNLNGSDIQLFGQLRGTLFEPAFASFDATGTILTAIFSELPDDVYTLFLYSGDLAFEDAVGNDLDGEPLAFPIPPNVTGDGIEGGTFFVSFSTDADGAIPVPLVAVEPLGSLVYQTGTPADATVAFPGDTDSFTINLDAGQVLTVVVTPISGAMTPTVELLDPTLTVIGSATAPGTDAEAVLQTVPVSTAGLYTIRVGSTAGGVGRYLVRVIANAALETEPNNSIAEAQSLAPTYLDLGNGITRGAVLGTSDGTGGYAGSAVPFEFIDISGTGTATLQGTDDDAVFLDLGASGFSFPFYGQSHSSLFYNTNGLITFGSPVFDFFNTDLSDFPFEAAIAALWDDMETFSNPGAVYWQLLGSGDDQQLVIQWNVGYFAFTGDMISFQAVLDEDGSVRFNYADLEDPNSFRSEGAEATVGVKNVGDLNPDRLLLSFNNGPNEFVGSGQSTLIEPLAPTTDFYSVDLAAGQSLTVALADLDGEGVHVELLDADGNVVAQGIPENELIANGSFETGDFTGWTTVTTGAPFIDWTVSGAGNGTGFDMAPTSPQDGSLVAWNGFDGEGPMQYSMHQDVTIPAGSALTLSWQDRVQWNFTVTGTATEARIYEVRIVDPATETVLETLHTFSTGTDIILGDSGWQTHTADLSAYAGQTIRLQFFEDIPEAFTGPAQIEFDAISINLGGPEPPANLDDLIADFVAPTDGTYYIHVFGDVVHDYNLVATIDASFDAEANDSFETAQDITTSEAVLGHVGNPPVFYGGTRFGELFRIDLTTGLGSFVGFLPGFASTEIEIDDTGFGFSQFPDGSFAGQGFDPTTGAAIGGVVANGASFTGLEFVGSTLYGTTISGPGSASELRTMDPVTGASTIIGATGFGPISGLAYDVAADIMYGITGGFGAGAQLLRIDLATGVATSIGVTGFQAGSLEFGPDGNLYAGGTGVSSGELWRVDIETGAGTLVGPTGFLNLTGLALFDSGDQEDWYRVTVGAGEAIVFETSTPSDGAGEFVNTLDPDLELYGPDGALVATGTDLADGRNERIDLVPSVLGDYRIRVRPEGGTKGEYVLAPASSSLARPSGPAGRFATSLDRPAAPRTAPPNPEFSRSRNISTPETSPRERLIMLPHDLISDITRVLNVPTKVAKKLAGRAARIYP